MIAEYQEALFTHGPWFYRPLFLESRDSQAGVASGSRSGGHRGHGHRLLPRRPGDQVFGFGGLEFQSLYHFTVGGPVQDSRLPTLATYGVHGEARELGADLP